MTTKTLSEQLDEALFYLEWIRAIERRQVEYVTRLQAQQQQCQTARLSDCESPIEIKFYLEAQYKIHGLQPQYDIGPYRADFAIPAYSIVIELDGHDYHKTKEQRTNDAQRERYFERVGWQVIRFTGSEIHADITQCVNEVIELIQRREAVDDAIRNY